MKPLRRVAGSGLPGPAVYLFQSVHASPPPSGAGVISHTTMDLSNLTPAKGATQSKKRIGRGEGSGKGGTATKGHKGQKSRSGGSLPAWFEGGQMPLQRRVPKFGFTNRNRVAYDAVNLSRLAMLAEDGFREHSRKQPGEIFVERYW